jgi:hypothetical protein
MTLDTLDAAFLRRWQVVPPLPAAVSDITAAAPPSVAAPPAAAFAAPVEPSTPTRSDRPPVAETAAAPLLDRLLAAAEPQWQAIAASRRRGAAAGA